MYLTQVQKQCRKSCMRLCVCCLGAKAWRGPGSGFSLHHAASEESQVPGQKDHRVSHDGECLLFSWVKLPHQGLRFISNTSSVTIRGCYAYNYQATKCSYEGYDFPS